MMHRWREAAILPCTATGVDALLAAAFDPLAAQLRVAAGDDHADLATEADIAVLKSDVAELKGDIAALRTATSAELGTIRWAVGLIAAFLFVIGLRVFGLF